MRLLAIDTALDACSVGVAVDGRAVTRSEIVGRGHAEILMRLVDAAMGEAGLAFADLDRIAVVVGPGSFTGVRVGIAAARGFALASGKPAVGISTLAAHAETARAAGASGPVLAVNAAGRGEAYGALFAADGSEIAPARAASPQIFAAMVTPGVVLAGSGVDLILAALPMDVRPAVAHRNAAPAIAALLALGARAAAPEGPPRPLYLRAPDAKPQAGAAIARR